MGRGKIEIKKIENPTNRQVTYSKRRNGIFKKAQELTVLCDAKVSLIMISNTGKIHEYISPTTTTKKIYDQYQKVMKTDLWKSHYEKMLDTLEGHKKVNNKLRREIRQRMGEDLNHLDYQELCSLEQKMEASVAIIRQQKFHKIKTKTGTYRKKLDNVKQKNGALLLGFEAKCGDPHYGLVESEGDYESAAAFANGASNLYAFRLHSSDHGAGYETHDVHFS
uniref:MADS box transcription factor APETALA3-2 n=1 Tax=Paeonia lactiflora TaxID=35924 RepID=A0A1Q1NK72_PAELC|nr:MADS box transcription factor APETALA3-2 [Paeonia lactiflora]